MSSHRAPFVLPLAFLGLFLTAWVGAGAPVPRQEPQVQLVGGRVSYIRNMGGNIAILASEEGGLMIDAQFAEVAQANEAAIREIVPAGPVYLVNTHWHSDHTSGNEYFATFAKILGHKNVRRRLAGDAEIGGRILEDTPPKALPVMTYEEGVTVYFGGETVRLMHVPHAHTDGDTVVHFVESNVIHMGDVYFEIGYPFIDLDSGGSVQGYIDGMKSVLAWAPAGAHILCGHGLASDLDGVRESLAMIETLQARVAEGLAAGKDAETMLAEGITADYDERWSWAFIDGPKFIETLVKDAAR